MGIPELLTAALTLAAPAPAEEALLARGTVLEERGDVTAAKRIYEDGRTRFPRNGEFPFRLGTLALQTNDWAEAIRRLAESRDLRPAHVEGRYYLAQAYHLHGEPQRALDEIEKAAAIDPSHAEVAQKQGEYLCEANNCREGLKHLERARRLDPTLAQIDFDLGMAHHRLAHAEEAQRFLEVALGKDASNLTAARFLADVLGRQDQWEKALDLYRSVVSRDPRNAWALYGVGRALVALGRYEEALRPLREALAVDPTIAEARYQLGGALRRLGHSEEGLRELGLFKAIRDRTRDSASRLSSPSTPAERAAWETSLKLIDAGKEEEALAHLQSLSTEDGTPAPYLLGALYFNVGRAPDAVRLLNRAAEVSPDSADILAFLGRARLAAGDSAGAEVALTRAVGLEPDAELPLVGLGELSYSRERWADAVRYFERSKTSQVPALLKLCRSHLGAGDRGKALETAELVRAFAGGEATWLRELDSILARPGDSPPTSPR